MIIKAIVIPTPKRIKKVMKKYITKERVGIYSLIGGGTILICLSKAELKGLSIGGLLYCGLAYEVLSKAEPEVLNLIMQTTDFVSHRYYY